MVWLVGHDVEELVAPEDTGTVLKNPIAKSEAKQIAAIVRRFILLSRKVGTLLNVALTPGLGKVVRWDCGQ